jgi:hypothetical protein
MRTLPFTAEPETTELIVLRGGTMIPLAALSLLWALEDRGFTVSVDGASLLVRPRSRLTPDDDRAIRAYQTELLALVAYSEVQ